MKQLLDFLPLILFFTIYKISPQVWDIGHYSITIGGIYSATATLLISSIIIYGGLYIKNRYLEKRDVITLIAVLIFGSLTLSFHNDAFIKWKAPVVNWIFAIVLIASQFIGEKPIMQRLLEQIVTLSPRSWIKLNMSWALFFLFLGSINLWVAFNLEKYWVDFKVFGSMGLTFLFTLIQFAFISRHLNIDNKLNKHTNNSNDV